MKLNKTENLPARPKKPPTEAQLLRVQELLEHPALDEYVKKLTEAKFTSFLATSGGTGLLIGILKKEIAKWEGTHIPGGAQ